MAIKHMMSLLVLVLVAPVFLKVLALDDSKSQRARPESELADRLPYGTLIARLPYETFELSLREGAWIGLFAVSADGQKFYISDASGNLLVFDRQGKRVAEIRMPVPLDCAEIGPDGSIVTVGSCQDLRLRFQPSNSDAEIEEIGDEQRIWVIRSDGTIDMARTNGFNRALGEFLDKHARSGDRFVQVVFYTGTRLGLQISAPVSLKDGKPVLEQEMGLLVLKDDGTYEGLYYAWAASGAGTLLLEDTRLVGLDAQNEWMSKGFSQEEYVIFDEDGKEFIRNKAPAYPKESVRMRLIQRQLPQNTSKDLSLKLQDLHQKEGVILSENGARLDAQGRLYLPGMTTESHIHLVPVPGQGRLPTQDGYVIARFTREGQFDKIVARLKMPIDGRPHQMWDIDEACNLYYLQFSTEGVEIHCAR